MLPNRFDILVPAMVRNSTCIPGAGEVPLAGMRAALRDLVLVVREDQVDAAGVDVEHVAPVARADQVERHGRTFEVPPGPAAAEWRIPRRAHPFGVFARCLPQDA